MSRTDWEAIIGLEVHLQLNTKTKLFSRAPNRFGDEPNTNIGLADTAQPGTLPVLNKEAVKKALLLGAALGSDISKISHFDRKSYFYPDSPRNFQITQFFHPIIKGGHVLAKVGDELRTFGIKQAHIEDDTGMLKHFSSFAGVDYNRAGVPLIEIVTQPCLRTPEEATAFATALRLLLIYLDISTCNMEEGALRMDVNVSVRKKGEKEFRSKTETKNLNSFHHMELAIVAEVERQIDLYEKHPHLPPSEVISSTTMRLDLASKKTIPMRSKVDAEDYRYFPEPDLPPLVLSDEEIDLSRKSLPELPHERLKRYIETLGLSEYQALLLINDKPLSDYFEQGLLLCSNPKTLCNWICVEFVGRLKDTGKHLLDIGLPAAHIAELVELVESKTITGKIAKVIADEMVKAPHLSAKKLIAENPDFLPLSDVDAVEKLIDEVLANNLQSVTDYRNGIEKAFHYLTGQIMKASKGKASPDVVKETLLKKLKP